MPCRLTADPAAAAAELRAGGVAAFPTETVYGLGAVAEEPAAVARIYALKRRPANHPLIIHLSTPDAIADWTTELSEAACALAERFMPGPLTLLLPRRPDRGELAAASLQTIALRVPAHPTAQALLRELDAAIAAPSANRYGRPSPTAAEHVQQEFADEDLLVLDGGPATHGLESSIVSIMPGEAPQLVRPGAISAADLAAVLGQSLATASQHRAPGTRKEHYRPRQQVKILDEEEYMSSNNGLEENNVIAYGFKEPRGIAAGHWLPMPADAAAAAQVFYRDIRVLEQREATVLLINQLPPAPAWDALRDRLQRMASD